MQKLLFDLMHNSFIATALLLFIGQSSALGVQSCKNYPESIGRTVIDTPVGLKILSTAKVSVPIDDLDLYLDAIEEAEMEAKASISAYFSEEINKDCTINNETVTIQDSMQASVQMEATPDAKDKDTNQKMKVSGKADFIDIQKIKTKLCSLASSTSMILKNVDNINSCYTPGKFVMVTVGIKPSITTESSKEP